MIRKYFYIIYRKSNWIWISCFLFHVAYRHWFKGPIHLPHLRIRKFFYGQLESYGSVSTYGRLETYGSVNFHDLIFFGSKCLKLPNSSRKVVKLRSKNFQCIYLINTYEIFKKILKILDLQIWDIRGFFAWKTFEIPQLMEKNSSDKS